MTSEHVPGLLKYDVCMTEQVSGPQGPKIAGRHMAMVPNEWKTFKNFVAFATFKASKF